jgi:hypothetical protein
VEEFIQSLHPTLFLLMVSFLVVMGGLVLVAGMQARRRASLIESTRTSLIDTASDGYRELEGIIESVGGRTLTAPLTSWQVCWYHAKVEQHASFTKHGGDGWRPVRSTTSSAPFLLRDSTGVCIVRPHAAEVTPTDRSVWYGRGPEPENRNPPRLAPTQSSTPMIEMAGGSNEFRYTEERIYAGDPLFVLGQFSRSSLIPESGVGSWNSEGGDESHQSAERTGAAGRVLDEEGELEELASRLARASIGKAAGKPLILSTTPQASHLALTEFGSEAAVYLAVVPFGLAALLLWTRFN